MSRRSATPLAMTTTWLCAPSVTIALRGNESARSTSLTMTLTLTVRPTGKSTASSKAILILRPPVALSTVGAAKTTFPPLATLDPIGLSSALRPSRTWAE